jgi:hypothetical protein
LFQHSGDNSNSLLPPLRIALRVKASNHEQSIDFETKEQTARKFPETSPMHIVKDNLELLWIFRHADDGGTDFLAKASPEPGPLRLVPILCVEELDPGSGRENYLHR